MNIEKYNTMKTIVYIFLVVIFTGCSSSYFHFSNKTMNKHSNAENTIRNGTWVIPIDSLSIEIVKYKNGEKKGKAYRFYTSQQSWDKYQYRNGKIHGIYQVFDIDGALLMEKTYVNGEITKISMGGCPFF
jgi:antitoxin component YwqK of YwqJK toxin-antitoxin module